MSHTFTSLLVVFLGSLVHGVSLIAAFALSESLWHVVFVGKCMHHRNPTAQQVSTFNIVAIVTSARASRGLGSCQ